MVTISIDGFWTTRAGDINPQKKITTPVSDDTFFALIKHNGKPNDAIYLEVLLDDTVAYASYDYLSTDGKEDIYFKIPSKLRMSGEHVLQFVTRNYDLQTRKVGDVIFQSEKFTLVYV
jgi:hypothetical protein